MLLSLTHICHMDIVQMYIHRDSRQESEMSPQRQLRLWDQVAPGNIGVLKISAYFHTHAF